jgi:hypothetical protein
MFTINKDTIKLVVEVPRDWFDELESKLGSDLEQISENMITEYISYCVGYHEANLTDFFNLMRDLLTKGEAVKVGENTIHDSLLYNGSVEVRNNVGHIILTTEDIEKAFRIAKGQGE